MGPGATHNSSITKGRYSGTCKYPDLIWKFAVDVQGGTTTFATAKLLQWMFAKNVQVSTTSTHAHIALRTWNTTVMGSKVACTVDKHTPKHTQEWGILNAQTPKRTQRHVTMFPLRHTHWRTSPSKYKYTDAVYKKVIPKDIPKERHPTKLHISIHTSTKHYITARKFHKWPTNT